MCKQMKKGHFLRRKCLDTTSPLGSCYERDEATQTSLKRWAGMGSCTRMGTTAALTSSTNPCFISPFPGGVKERAKTGGSKQTDTATHKQSVFWKQNLGRPDGNNRSSSYNNNKLLHSLEAASEEFSTWPFPLTIPSIPFPCWCSCSHCW